MFENIFDLSGLEHFADASIGLYLVLAFVVLWLARWCNQRLAGYSLREQLTGKDNKAIATSFAGFVLALCVILSGVLSSPSDAWHDAEWWCDLTETTIWSVLGVLLLLVTRIINDKLMFPQFCNRKELVEDKNVGLGAAQAGSYIATALIIRAVSGGESVYSLGEEVGLTVIWFVVTQLLLIGFSHLYQKLAHFDLRAELEKDNVAAGVGFGGTLIAFAWVLGYLISEFDSLAVLGIGAIAAGILLLLSRFLVDRLLLPSSKLNDEICQDRNWGAALIETATAIGVAFILTGAVH